MNRYGNLETFCHHQTNNLAKEYHPLTTLFKLYFINIDFHDIHEM